MKHDKIKHEITVDRQKRAQTISSMTPPKMPKYRSKFYFRTIE